MTPEEAIAWARSLPVHICEFAIPSSEMERQLLAGMRMGVHTANEYRDRVLDLNRCRVCGRYERQA